MILVIFIMTIPVTAFAQSYPELGVRVETVAENLDTPWSIVWAPDGTIFFTERPGNLRIIKDGILIEKPILSLNVGGSEGGLLGITLDPNYSTNHFIYLYYTYNDLFSTANKVVRFTSSDTSVLHEKIIIDKIPGGPIHDGGRIKFGPDGKIYISTGDAGNPNLAQDKESLAGKILRLNSDGTIPEDNPFPNSPIYSYGHRNPQGFDWDKSGIMVATEHGPTGWRGIAHDEINIIKPGVNYGWPEIVGSEKKEGLQNPIFDTGTDTWAPSGAVFYYGDKISLWQGKYLVATLRGTHLHIVDFDLKNNSVLSHQKLFLGEYGRLRDVVTGPDGYLYVLTSNRDGRGDPAYNDDRILRIVPIIENFTLSPLKQIKNGVAYDEVQCKSGMVLIFKNNGNSACFKNHNVSKLISRGWSI